MNAISGGEAGLRGLMGVAFAGGEPALPDVDSLITEIEVMGGRIRHRQRVRTSMAAAVLCVAGFGMVAGIAAIAHSNPSGTTLIPGSGGGVVSTSTSDQVPESPPSADTGP